MAFFRSLFSKIKGWGTHLLGVLALVFWKNKKSVILVYSSLILNIISWGLFSWMFFAGDTTMIVHYNAFFGIDFLLHTQDRMASFAEVFLGPISGFCFFVINVIVATSLMMLAYDRKKMESGEKLSLRVLGGDLEEIDIDKTFKFGALLVLFGGVILQAIILVYSIAISIVNY